MGRPEYVVKLLMGLTRLIHPKRCSLRGLNTSVLKPEMVKCRETARVGKDLYEMWEYSRNFNWGVGKSLIPNSMVSKENLL